jgi:hypothetical protein
MKPSNKRLAWQSESPVEEASAAPKSSEHNFLSGSVPEGFSSIGLQPPKKRPYFPLPMRENSAVRDKVSAESIEKATFEQLLFMEALTPGSELYDKRKDRLGDLDLEKRSANLSLSSAAETPAPVPTISSASQVVPELSKSQGGANR